MWLVKVAGSALLAFAVLSPFPAAADAWGNIDYQSLAISEGSILDFSAIARSSSETDDSVQNGKDMSVAARLRDLTLGSRFLCASQPFGIEEGFPDHATAERYARQLRMHGYNIARFHFVENVFMNGRRRDFDFDSEQVDRFHYFLAALKKEGIGWLLDGLTSANAAYGDVGGDRWIDKRNVKVGVYYDSEQQAHWKELTRRVLGERNKYTGRTVLEDPALAGLILVNEGGLNHLTNLTPSREMNQMFERWLVGKYGSKNDAVRRVGRQAVQDGHIVLPYRNWSASSWVVDAQRFFYQTQKDTFLWMADHVRSIGYAGLVTAFDNWTTLQDHATRAMLSWVDMHAYHDGPSDFISAGSRINQSSSLEGAVPYIREIANSRYWGKPFTVTEYDQPFWNRWRFESGIAPGAYAALQQWNLLCRHGSGPIELAYEPGREGRRRAIYPHGIGMDPIARAAETLTALLYLRGDVSPARHRVGIHLSDEYVFDRRGGIGKLPEDLSKLSLITGVGLVWSDDKPHVALDAFIDPDGRQPTTTNKLAAALGVRAERSLTDWLDYLKEQGILKNNQSDGQNVFVSDTEEIFLDAASMSLRIITPHTEAAAFAAAPGQLEALTITQASGPALVSASAMDGASLARSNRILLIVASDAQNSRMRFADIGQKELTDIGGMPIRLKNVSVDLDLRRDNAMQLSLYALHLNGDRAKRLPLRRVGDNSVSISLHTVSRVHAPTTFFELVAE